MNWITKNSPTQELAEIVKGNVNPCMKDAEQLATVKSNVAKVWGGVDVVVSRTGYVFDNEEGMWLGRIDAKLNFYESDFSQF